MDAVFLYQWSKAITSSLTSMSSLLLLVLMLDVAVSQESEDGGAESSKEWFVGSQGSHNGDCGSHINSPCKSIDRILIRLTGDDHIHIMGKYASTHMLCNPAGFNLTGNLTIAGNEGVTIKCSTGSDPLSAMMSVRSNNPSNTLTFDNIHLENTTLFTSGNSISFTKCKLVHVPLYFLNSFPQNVLFNMKQSEVLGGALCSPGDNCSATGTVELRGNVSEVILEDTVFKHAKVNIQLSTESQVIFQQVTMTSADDMKPVVGGFFVSLATTSINSSVLLKDSLIENQYHFSPINSVMNIFMGTFLVRLMDPYGRRLPQNNVSVTVDNTTFQNNERALTLQGQLTNVYVSNSRFISNIAMHAGAGILLLTDYSLTITNCLFENNAAGQFRSIGMSAPGDFFHLIGDEVTIHSECCKGSITLIGKGGAIRAQKGYVSIFDSVFKNNSARVLGGSIFVDRKQTLIIENCTFENSENRKLASQQGEILYSSGKVQMRGVKFNIASANDYNPFLMHSGDIWSMKVLDVRIDCPVGHRLRVMNTSAYKVVSYTGLKRAYMLDQLSYFCESCPRFKYSTDRGSLIYRLDEGVYDYFTLMINGSSPNFKFHGTYSYNDIVCSDCPYGADCQDNIRSLPNFWGYMSNNVYKFQLCPKGYCCGSHPCPGPNTCASHRGGVLCGVCQEGYTEALFSVKCLPNDVCGPAWIWAFFFSTGALYTLVLLFQKDIRDFIFTWGNDVLIGILMCSCLRRHKRKTQMNNSIGKSKSLVDNGKLLQKEEGGIPHDEAGPYYYSNSHCHETIYSDGKIRKQELAEEASEAQEAKTDIGAILLIIVLYYFQDAVLFDVKIANQIAESKVRVLMKKVLLGLFKFRLEIFHFVDHVCLMAGLTSWQKLLAKAVLAPYIVFIFFLFYAVCSLIQCCSKEKGNFLTRLSNAFMLGLLFLYQMLATTSFTLLNCVPIANSSVLFIDGSVECYSQWQYYVTAYAVCSIIPFSFVLLLGPSLLNEGRISLKAFFTSCIFPLPFVIHWAILRLVTQWVKLKASRNGLKNKPENKEISPEVDCVIQVLQGPFRYIYTRPFGPVCWAGIQMFRRLILVLLFTFINNTLIRLISMVLVTFLILLQHVYVQPYKDPIVNRAASASVSALLLLGGINLVRASFDSAEYVPHGPNADLMFYMRETETILMLWIPLFIMCCIFLVLGMKLFLFMHIKIRAACCQR